jgi:membrane protein
VLVWRALRRTSKDGLTNVAAALAYYAFLSIPSALLVLLGIFGLVASPADVRQLLTHLEGIVPQSAITLIEDSLVRTTGASSGGLLMIVAGVVLALWTLTGAMTTLMWALNIAFGHTETRGFVRQRLVALQMLGLVAASVLLMFGLLVLGAPLSGWVGDAIGQPGVVSWVWWIAEWPILLAALFVAFAGILYLGPSGERARSRLVSIGGVVAVVIWLAASGAFALYASRFGSYNKAWGSLAAVIIMLTWLWISSLALLVGAEIEAEAERSEPAGDSSAPVAAEDRDQAADAEATNASSAA